VQELCDGTLHELHPEDVRYRTKQGRDARLTQLSTFFPVLGDKTFDQITGDDIDEAKRLIPKGVKQGTRSRYLRELRFLLRIAVDPLALCERTPTVKVLKGEPRGVFQLLYPAEEAQLCACLEIPIERRILYAFLARNGGRVSETLQYTFQCIDADGVIHVAKEWTKTKKARYWQLAPDVLEALRLRRAQMPEGATLIFVPPTGERQPIKQLTRHHVLRMLNLDLKTAGITRQGLVTALAGERKLCTHDVRASFVTLARAAGMSDRWIMDRSGHESAAVFEKYDRGVRHAREIHLGWWAPMAIALGLPGAECEDTAIDAAAGSVSGPKLGQSWAKGAKRPMNSAVRANGSGMGGEPSHPINPVKTGGEGPQNATREGLGPADLSISGQSSSPPETTPGPVEQALAAALPVAIAAEQWDLAQAIMQELGERRRARVAPGVTSLADARRKRDEGGGK
jgi:integrase